MDKSHFITELFDDDKIKLDPAVSEELYNAMVEKASEIVFESKKIMRHSRRKDLRANDVETVLMKYG